MKNKIKIFFLLTIILASSCSNDEECRKDRYVAMSVNFFAKKYSVTRDTITISALSVDSLTIRGIKQNGILLDSMLYNNVKKIKTINLPLNSFEGKSAYLMTFNNIKDTVMVWHTITNEFLSLECGCLKIHEIDTVRSTTHFIDSIRITNQSVNTTTNAENLRIYHTVN